MEQPAINQHVVRRYLLGELPERERERLEVGLLTDDGFYETLTALEEEVGDELIDQYLDGELTELEREKFERVFLNTPERTHKLKVIKDLKKHAAAPKELHKYAPVSAEPNVIRPSSWQRSAAFAVFQNPLVGLSTTAALALALLACVWLIIRSNRLQAELMQAQAQHPTDTALKERVEQLNRQNEELATRLKQSEQQRLGLEEQIASLKTGKPQAPSPNDKPSPSGTSFATVILSPSLRSTSGNEAALTLGPGVTEARLVLNVERINPRDFKRFRAVVKNRTGAEIWRDEDVKLQARGNNARATLSVPADKLAKGQYVGELDGITADDQTESVGLYLFRVVVK